MSDFMTAPTTEAFPTPSEVCLGQKLRFPAYGEDSLISNVLFITGKRGSGKSWTAGVMMEEFHRLGLQFVCFDPLNAHGGIDSLPRVESLKPDIGQSIDMKSLVERLRTTDKSLIIAMGGLPLLKQQELVGDYCEALISARLGKGIHTVLEECQDFVPQMGRPISFDPIVRLCKLGRALGYGGSLVSQRPAGVNKEALSQASVYLVHNVINNRDLKTLDEQLSFGTDKRLIKKILNGIASARKGECVAYAPEFFRDRGYLVIDKIRSDRQAKHTGHNIDVQSSMGSHDADTESVEEPFNSVTSASELSGFARQSSPFTEKMPSASPAFLGDKPFQEMTLNDNDRWEATEPEHNIEYDSETKLEMIPDNKTTIWVPVAAVGGVGLTAALMMVVMKGFSR
jgi:hypothetical protein|tara:strand:- start:909 stop:2102 length:1194 start_codon:yes stop_codon:yes gene_type:complete